MAKNNKLTRRDAIKLSAGSGIALALGTTKGFSETAAKRKTLYKRKTKRRGPPPGS
ncbi:twin-arginine translocation signal domain-containing protein [Cyclobacterium qasimii]|uniref:Twin-arginine translocation signal domain-containing protein n=1 Tax=Cyclobacterium qasimii M12-11B TaxID=641524 RepID=S7WR28_9BACT|nr:twin-arginine translocation signal domain-containing protein [Cyclobacterium qasimii]EPR66578.1 hypothetical protein ADICYQ_4340 [Cyclobacterium qasimii M12-11B]